MENKEAFGYIYLVKNLVNGKMYFGITENDFDTRYKHGDISNTHNEHLKLSIEKYGIENFEINKEFDVAYNEDDLYDLEDMYMCIYNTIDRRYGYNKQRSGSKHRGHGKHSEDSKHKISETKKGYKHKKESIQKMSEQRRGKCIGENNPMYGKKGELSPFYGKHHTEEWKQKRSEEMNGENNPRARKVICIETLQVFNTIKEAQEWCNIKSGVGGCCRGQSKYAGKHPITKQPLHWMYYDEYLKLQEEQSNKTQDLVTEVA